MMDTTTHPYTLLGHGSCPQCGSPSHLFTIEQTTYKRFVDVLHTDYRGEVVQEFEEKDVSPQMDWDSDTVDIGCDACGWWGPDEPDEPSLLPRVACPGVKGCHQRCHSDPTHTCGSGCF